jgi:hypothetical protein
MLLFAAVVPDAFWVLEEGRGDGDDPCAVKSLFGFTLFCPFANGKKVIMVW